MIGFIHRLNRHPRFHLIKMPSDSSLAASSETLKGFSHLEMDLTAYQWSLLEPLLVAPPARAPRGRPKQDAQAVLNGIFWVLRTGARWADLPKRYPSYQTCHRRFQQWFTSGTLFACFEILAADLYCRGDASQDSHLVPEGAHVLAPGAGRRSWQLHTALLLECPLAREALAPRRSDDHAMPDSTPSPPAAVASQAPKPAPPRRHL
jgi:transposase